MASRAPTNGPQLTKTEVPDDALRHSLQAVVDSLQQSLHMELGALESRLMERNPTADASDKAAAKSTAADAVGGGVGGGDSTIGPPHWQRAASPMPTGMVSLANASNMERVLQKLSADTIYGKTGTFDAGTGSTDGSTSRPLLKRSKAVRLVVDPQHARHGIPMGVFSPSDVFRQTWDMVAIVLVLVLSWSLPYRLAFTDGTEGQGLVVFDILMDCFFMLDICLNATTAFVDDDHLVYSRCEILKHYARTWLLVDLAASLPVDLMVLGVQPSAFVNSYGADERLTVLLVKIPKLLRLVRLVRSWHTIETNVTFWLAIPHYLLRFFRVLFFIALITHWFACLQYLLAALDGFSTDSWVVRAHLVEVGGVALPKGGTAVALYSHAFLHAFLQVLVISKGLVNAERTVEVWATIAAFIIGVVTQAVLVASLTALISSLDASGRDYQQSLDMLNQYMRHARLSRPLRAKLRRFYALLYPGGKSFDEERILGRLSRSLLEEVTCTLCRPVLQALSVVEGKEPGLAGALSKSLHRTVYVKGDYIIREGEPASTMYFIESGEVEVLSAAKAGNNGSNDEGKIATLSQGSLFGEMALLSREGLTLATVRVTEACVVMYLERSAYENIVSQYPAFARYVEAVARLRLNSTGGGGDQNESILAEKPVAATMLEDAKRFASGVASHEASQESELAA